MIWAHYYDFQIQFFMISAWILWKYLLMNMRLSYGNIPCKHGYYTINHISLATKPQWIGLICEIEFIDEFQFDSMRFWKVMERIFKQNDLALASFSLIASNGTLNNCFKSFKFIHFDYFCVFVFFSFAFLFRRFSLFSSATTNILNFLNGFNLKSNCIFFLYSFAKKAYD